MPDALDAAGDKNPVATDAKDGGKSAGDPSRGHGNDGSNVAPGTTGNPGTTGDPGTAGDPGAVRDPGGLFGSNPNDLGGRDLTGLGFDGGFQGTPGFPGAPGFVGSSAGGSFALPIPVVAPVTSVVNQ